MNVGFGTFVAAVVVAGLLVATCWYLSKRRLLRGRQLRTVTEILGDLPGDVGRDEASQVLHLIGKSFGLPPGILRLDDPMSALLQIDSWRLDSGSEELERWLEAKGVGQLQCESITVRAFIILFVSRSNSSGRGAGGESVSRRLTSK